MLIASNPKLLLLDEPTTGMTEAGKNRTAELIRKIAESHTVLLGRARHAHRPAIGEKGDGAAPGSAFWPKGPLAEVVENRSVREVYLGKGKFQ